MGEIKTCIFRLKMYAISDRILVFSTIRQNDVFGTEFSIFLDGISVRKFRLLVELHGIDWNLLFFFM